MKLRFMLQLGIYKVQISFVINSVSFQVVMTAVHKYRFYVTWKQGK